MTITQFEQSGIIIESDSGQRLAIDIGALTPLEKLTGVTADVMLVSHIHVDHCAADRVAALAPNTVYTGAECAASLTETDIPITEISDGQSFTAGDFAITPFEVDHGPNTLHVPEQNFGFLIEVDGKTIYFAGDMFTPSGIDVTDLSVDAALLPVGGHFTFDAETAFSFAKTFQSIGTVYPIRHESFGPIDTDGHKAFAELAGDAFSVAY